MENLRRSTRRSNAAARGRPATIADVVLRDTDPTLTTTMVVVSPVVKRGRKGKVAKVGEQGTGAGQTVSVHASQSTCRASNEIEAALDLAISLDDGNVLRQLLVEIQSSDDARLAARVHRACKEHDVEANRLHGMLRYEQQILADERARLVAEGCTDVLAAMQRFAIIGVDEVGVGPLVGPLVGGAVVLHRPAAPGQVYGAQCTYVGINDSKKLKAAQREQLAEQIQQDAVCHALGICTSQEVDQLNPRGASMEAMRRAVQVLLDGPLRGFRVHLLVDYHTVPGMAHETGQTCLEKGDAKSQSIAAASIVAKVYRDAYMKRLHDRHPHFGFDRNAGYGTREHMAALQSGLLCPEHRLSFAPVRIAHERVHGAKHKSDDNDGNDVKGDTEADLVKPVQKRTRKAMLPISVNQGRRRTNVRSANERSTRQRRT